MHFLSSWVHGPNLASKTKLLALPHHRSGRVATDYGDALWVEHAGKGSVRLWHVSATKFAK
jgi:hypothetical protein